MLLPTQNLFSSSMAVQTFLAFTLLFNLTISSAAQSGRNKSTQNKSTQNNPPATQTQPPEKQEEAVKPKNNEESRLRILVVFYRPIMANVGIYSNIVARGCLESLSQSTFIKAGGGTEMNRKEAYDFAKASKDTYVLWFQLEAEIGETENVRNRTIPSVVNFVLFTPETGKSKSSGHVYTRSRGTLPTGIPSTNYPGEYQLHRAGQELAERIMDTLSLPKLPRRI